jgi:nicotinate-nucleotide adenylyltransferase
MRTSIGIFGGTFDPVHLGHLRLALELKQSLQFDEMRLLPCHLPAHRTTPEVTSDVRAQMLQMALRDCPELQLDLRELKRESPSYTYDTLVQLRAELGIEVSISFCMGADSFVGLASWHRWQELLKLAHLVVVARPGWELPRTGVLAELLAQHQCAADALSSRPAGGLLCIAPRLLPISATEIRALVAAGQSPQFLLPDAVWQFIQNQGLYRHG